MKDHISTLEIDGRPHRYRVATDARGCATATYFAADDASRALGYIRWRALPGHAYEDGVQGMTENIIVHDSEMRLKGIGKALWRIAEHEAATRGWNAPVHDPKNRTHDGQKFSASLGAESAQYTMMPDALFQGLLDDAQLANRPDDRPGEE